MFMVVLGRAMRVRGASRQLGERFVERALLSGQLRWQLDVDTSVQITLLVGLADRRHSESFQPEHLAVLRERRDSQARRPAGKSLYVGLTAQYGGRDRQRHLDVQVAPFAFEHRMRRQADPQVQIARRGAANTVLTLAGDANARSVANAGRNPHVYRADLAIVFERQPPRRAVERVVERQVELVLDVAAGPLTGACTPRPAAGTLEASAAAPAKEGREEVRERAGVPEHLLHLFLGHRPVAAARRTADVDVPLPGERTAGATGGAGLFVLAPVRAQLVVLFPLGGVAEDFVGLVDLLELRLRGFVARVHVRVILPRQLPEGLLDLLFGSGLGDAERGVVVLEFHDLQSNGFGEPADLCQQLTASRAARQRAFVHQRTNALHRLGDDEQALNPCEIDSRLINQPLDQAQAFELLA